MARDQDEQLRENSSQGRQGKMFCINKPLYEDMINHILVSFSGVQIYELHIFIFIIKFPYNARSDWLKQRPLSENKVQVNDIKLAFKFLLRNFDKFDPN